MIRPPLAALGLAALFLAPVALAPTALAQAPGDRATFADRTEELVPNSAAARTEDLTQPHGLPLARPDGAEVEEEDPEVGFGGVQPTPDEEAADTPDGFAYREWRTNRIAGEPTAIADGVPPEPLPQPTVPPRE